MKITDTLYRIGAIVLLIGAALKIARPLHASYIYITGAVLFAVMQFIGRERGGNIALRRLVFQQQFGGIALIAAGVLMFTHIRNEWIVALFIGALFELYTAYRIPQEKGKIK